MMTRQPHSQMPSRAPASLRGLYWRRFRRNRLAYASLVFLVVTHGVCLLAPWLLSESVYTDIDLFNTFAGPSWSHPLGTDENGRNVLMRLIFGGRLSLVVGLVAMAIALGIGMLVGGVSGFWGGMCERVLMRFTDGMLSIPTFFLLLLILSIFRGEVTTVLDPQM